MADRHVVGSIRVDSHVGGQRHALFVDGGPKVEVLDERCNIDADLVSRLYKQLFS